MQLKHNSEEVTLYLNETLAGYEVIPANWGWHIHKGNVYCGYLQYQGVAGWEGSALNYLPNELKEQLKKFALSEPSPHGIAALGLKSA
jgi:hypothetical protein